MASRTPRFVRVNGTKDDERMVDAFARNTDSQREKARELLEHHGAESSLALVLAELQAVGDLLDSIGVEYEVDVGDFVPEDDPEEGNVWTIDGREP